LGKGKKKNVAEIQKIKIMTIKNPAVLRGRVSSLF